MYDVIIAGAGPSGSAAAKHLAESGMKVLLAEKFALPRYKSCSGQLIHKSLELIRDYFGADVPRSAQCTPVENRGMVLTDDQGQVFRFEQTGLNVWRAPFDQWLAEQAQAAGADLRDGTAVLSAEEQADRVIVSLRGARAYHEEARYLLDCEGVIGALQRQLTRRPGEYITTFQTFHEGQIELDPHYFYAYLQPELSEYDAWFNVKDGLLTLGVAVRDAAHIERHYERFLQYMRERHGLRIGEAVRRDKWLMPRIRPGCPLTLGDGRILYAGEIAGFLNPMGEGVSAGLESGHCAAQAICAHPQDPDAIQADYRRRTEALRAYMARQWRLVAGMSAALREFSV